MTGSSTSIQLPAVWSSRIKRPSAWLARFFRTIFRLSPLHRLVFRPSTLIRSDKNNFAPRVGFAYRSPFGGLVVRGGYGIYYSLEYQRAFSAMTGGPFVGTQTYDNTIKNGTPLWTWPSIVPAGVAPNSLGIQDVDGVSPNLPSSYMQQWSFSLDKQFGQNGLRVSYIGEDSVASAVLAES